MLFGISLMGSFDAPLIPGVRPRAEPAARRCILRDVVKFFCK